MPRTGWSIGVLLLLLIAVAMASGLALVSADPLPRYRLDLEAAYKSNVQSRVGFALTVKNVSIDGEPVEARNVAITITPLQKNLNCPEYSCNVVSELSSGAFNA